MKMIKRYTRTPIGRLVVAMVATLLFMISFTVAMGMVEELDFPTRECLQLIFLTRWGWGLMTIMTFCWYALMSDSQRRRY